MAHAKDREQMTKRDDEAKAAVGFGKGEGEEDDKNHSDVPPEQAAYNAACLAKATEGELREVLERRYRQTLGGCTTEELETALASKLQAHQRR